MAKQVRRTRQESMAHVKKAVGEARDMAPAEEESGWSQTRREDGKDGSYR